MRVATATFRKIDRYPWYDWVDEFRWEDDEFEEFYEWKKTTQDYDKSEDNTNAVCL